jgi:AAA15 family ATPase/GTPase
MEMEDASCIIQKMEDMIVALEEEKQLLIEKNESEMDIAIIESEILVLETKLNNDIDSVVQYCCNHVFVDDLIDINPDESRMIRYCTLCLFTDEK